MLGTLHSCGPGYTRFPGDPNSSGLHKITVKLNNHILGNVFMNIYIRALRTSSVMTVIVSRKLIHHDKAYTKYVHLQVYIKCQMPDWIESKWD